MRWRWRPLVALGPVPLAVVGWADDHVVGVAMLVVGVIPFAAMALGRRPRWSMAGVTVGLYALWFWFLPRRDGASGSVAAGRVVRRDLADCRDGRGRVRWGEVCGSVC